MSNNLTFGMRLTYEGKAANAGLEETRAGVEKINAAAGKAGGAAKQFGTASEDASKRAAAGFGKARDGADALAGQLNRLQALALSYVGVSQFVNFGKALIDTSVAMDGFNAKMAIASGSAKNVAAEYEYLRQLSNRLGTEVRGTADAYASFASAARGTALEGAKAREVFAGIATASARMNLNVEAQKGVFYALSQMMSKGVVSAEEFRQQLSERLPIATTAAAAALGVTTAKFGELLNSGKLVSEEFLPKFAAQLEKMAGGGGPVDNLQASINRLSNNWTDFYQAVSKSAALKDGTDWFAGLAAGATDVANAVNRTQQEYGTLIALLAGVGFSMAKMTGVELDPQKRAQADLNGMLKEQLVLRRDIALLSSRSGALEAEKAAEARARLSELNAQIKAQIDLVNAPVNTAGAAAAKRRADEEAQAKTRAASEKKTLSEEQIKAIEAEKKAYDKLNESVTGRIAVLGAEVDAGAKLTESQKKLIELGANYKAGLTAQNEAEQQAYIALLAQAAGLEQAAAAQDAATKAAKEATKAEQEYMIGIGKETESLIAKAKAAEEENALIGMSAVQIAELTARRYDEQIAIKEAEAARLRGIEGRSAEADLIDIQIAALEKLKKAEVTRPALQAQAEAWKNFTRDIESSTTDAIQRGLEKGGRDGAQVALDTIRNTLRTIPIKIGAQVIVSPIMGGIQGMFSGGAAGGSSGNGALGYVNAGQNLWSGFSGGMASSLGSMAMSAGEMFGSAALAEFGVGATYAGAGGTIAGAAASSTAAGMGAAVATAMPYVAAAYAAYSLLGGNGGTPGTNVGAAYNTYDASGSVTARESWAGLSAPTNQPGVEALTDAMNRSYLDAARALGASAADTVFSLSQNLGENSEAPQFFVRGGIASNDVPAYASGWTPQSDAALQLAASRAVLAALQGSDLPEYLRNVFSGVTASTATQEQISGTLAYAQSLKTLRDSLAETRTPLEIAQAQMSSLSAEFGTSAETFRSDFVAAIDAGIAPPTLARWQQLGAAIDQVNAQPAAATQANAQHAAALADLMSGIDYQAAALGMSALDQSLLDITRSTDDAVARATELGATEAELSRIRALGTSQAGQASAQVAADLARTNLGIQQQIDVLQGTQTQRQVELANALEGADASTASLINQLYGLQDAANNATAAGSAMQTARQSALQDAQSLYDTAKSRLLESYNRESSAAQQLADRMRGFASSFSAMRDSLALGNFSPLSRHEKYLEATRQFNDVSARAALGDTEAMGQFAGVRDAFLQASQDYNASSEAFAADYNRAQDATQRNFEVASRQADIATSQVGLLQSQLSALGLIDTHVLSMVDALAAFTSARSAQQSATVAATTGYASTTAQVAATAMAGAGNAPDPVESLFQSILGRGSRPEGHAFWADALQRSSLADVTQGIMASPEYAGIKALRGFDEGGTASRGYYIAHENELIYSDAATRIHPAEQTSALLSRLGGGDSKELIAETKALNTNVAKLIAAIEKQTGAVVGAVDDAANTNALDLRSLKQSLAHNISKLAA